MVRKCKNGGEKNYTIPTGFEPGLPGQEFFVKFLKTKFLKLLPAFFAPIFANATLLILVVQSYAVALYMV